MSHVAAPTDAPVPGSLTGRGTQLQWRYVKDRVARWGVGVGGIAVLVALVLIFFYLLLEVLPLFGGADLTARPDYALPGDATATLFVTAEEQAEIGMRVAASGDVTFFEVATGAVRSPMRLPLPQGVSVAQIVEVAPEAQYLAAALSDGSVLPFKHTYEVTYPDNRRNIEPALEYPHGEQPLSFLPAAPATLAVRDEGDELLFVGTDAAGAVHLKGFDVTEGLLGGSTLETKFEQAMAPSVAAGRVLVNPLIDWLYVIDTRKGRIAFHRLRGAEAPELLNTVDVGAAVTQAEFLAGGISLLTADARGIVTQWFPATGPSGEPELARIRAFDPPGEAPITAIGVEHRRRGFAVGDASGRVTLFHATADRQVLSQSVAQGPIERLAFEPRARALLAVAGAGRLHAFAVDNEHPEVSWRTLWQKVWYESYDEPRHLWQSSSASADFEAKFSLTPLTVGTLKGAFYAMIFAVPLAVLGAIFTANFMAPPMRSVVKPTVEIMQALPTVILGFLAGLWLAPFVETYLPGVFLTLLLLPLAIPVLGFGWAKLPLGLRQRVPDGWEAALMIPAVAVVVWLSFALALPVEAMLFDGNMQAWMDHELGIGYEQRNCLVVGIAMGVAVIPGIYSIAEDAIFSVPNHLSLGSLALGATPWQTLMGVVLPTASPGIFSAIMIGMGRAVGETMIVLMATGNTPVMDFSMFSGMRTLSANVAVEMPESEVGSTHFRLLFLAGLVLFLMTFVFNTMAEVVRQNLRRKYGNL